MVDADDRWTDNPIGIIRDAKGNIKYPTDPEEQERALQLEEAWRLWNDENDDTLLVRLGIFPER